MSSKINSLLVPKLIGAIKWCGFAPQGDGRALKMVIEPTISSLQIKNFTLELLHNLIKIENL